MTSETILIKIEMDRPKRVKFVPKRLRDNENVPSKSNLKSIEAKQINIVVEENRKNIKKSKSDQKSSEAKQKTTNDFKKSKFSIPKSSKAKQINIVVEEIEKNPKIACDETFSKSIATNSALREVIFCQEILGQYCYTVEHIPILNLNNSKSDQKSIELNEEPDSLSDSNSSNHELDAKLQKFNCELCTEIFSSENNLMTHKELKHDISFVNDSDSKLSIQAPISSSAESTKPSEAFLQTISSGMI